MPPPLLNVAAGRAEGVIGGVLGREERGGRKGRRGGEDLCVLCVGGVKGPLGNKSIQSKKADRTW